MEKKKISKREYAELIDEILQCQAALEKRFDKYTVNAVVRLIDARIKLASSTVDSKEAS